MANLPVWFMDYNANGQFPDREKVPLSLIYVKKFRDFNLRFSSRQ